MSNQNTNQNYFFCYSIKLYSHIKHQHNIPYITKGTNPSTNMTYWLFEKTDQLKQILNSWSNSKPIQSITQTTK